MFGGSLGSASFSGKKLLKKVSSIFETSVQFFYYKNSLKCWSKTRVPLAHHPRVVFFSESLFRTQEHLDACTFEKRRCFPKLVNLVGDLA